MVANPFSWIVTGGIGFVVENVGVETPGSDIIEIAENQWNRRVNDDEENADGAGPGAVLDGRGGALQH